MRGGSWAVGGEGVKGWEGKGCEGWDVGFSGWGVGFMVWGLVFRVEFVAGESRGRE